MSHSVNGIGSSFGGLTVVGRILLLAGVLGGCGGGTSLLEQTNGVYEATYAQLGRPGHADLLHAKNGFVNGHYTTDGGKSFCRWQAEDYGLTGTYEDYTMTLRTVFRSRNDCGLIDLNSELTVRYHRKYRGKDDPRFWDGAPARLLDFPMWAVYYTTNDPQDPLNSTTLVFKCADDVEATELCGLNSTLTPGWLPRQD